MNEKNLKLASGVCLALVAIAIFTTIAFLGSASMEYGALAVGMILFGPQSIVRDIYNSQYLLMVFRPLGPVIGAALIWAILRYVNRSFKAKTDKTRKVSSAPWAILILAGMIASSAAASWYLGEAGDMFSDPTVSIIMIRLGEFAVLTGVLCTTPER